MGRVEEWRGGALTTQVLYRHNAVLALGLPRSQSTTCSRQARAPVGSGRPSSAILRASVRNTAVDATLLQQSNDHVIVLQRGMLPILANRVRWFAELAVAKEKIAALEKHGGTTANDAVKAA